jgi:hypothetical protein
MSLGPATALCHRDSAYGRPVYATRRDGEPVDRRRQREDRLTLASSAPVRRKTVPAICHGRNPGIGMVRRTQEGDLMTSKRAGSVYKRCGCREDTAGLRLGASCQRLGEEGHGSWFFSMDLPRHVGGVRRRLRRGGYATREDAGCALERLRLPGGRVLTVADWLEVWLTTRVRLRATTMRSYSAHVRRYLIPHLGMVLLAELDAGHLEKVFTALLTQEKLTVATLRRVHSTLRSALNAAVREKLGDVPVDQDRSPRYLYSILRGARSELVSVGELRELRE